MKIFVKARPEAKENRVEKESDNVFIVYVKEPPVKGRANKALIALLAEYFQTSPSGVKIITGHTSRLKQVEIK